MLNSCKQMEIKHLKNIKSDSVISKGIPLPRCDSQVMLNNIHLSLD